MIFQNSGQHQQMHSSTIYIFYYLVPTCSGIIAIGIEDGDNAGTCRSQLKQYIDCRIVHLLVLCYGVTRVLINQKYIHVKLRTD
jgi:hypothetical protein